LPLLPVTSLSVNFNEQKTPLILLKKFGKRYGFSKLYCKDESKNPTGSFKDKQCAITINKAFEWQIKNIIIASSGNAAVSTTAYASKANISSVCFVTRGLSVGKRFLISLYGGKLQEFGGTYETVYRNAIDMKNKGWNVTPGINTIQDEGAKIIGFEIWEDINVPDIILTPCGNGTLLFGLYKAFVELFLLKKINKIPQFIGIQIKNSSPLRAALEQKKDWVALSTGPDSMAEGIIALESYSSPKVMKALKKTNGYIIEVSESEIKQAMKEIISLEGLLPEPTAATVFAGIKKIPSTNKIIVCVQTAGGQKNLKEIMESFLN
jgi:threonine synthase